MTTHTVIDHTYINLRQNRITLPTPPFTVEIDPARRDTAPRGPAIRSPDLDETRGPWAPAKVVKAVAKRAGIMDMGGGL
jgi:hypothetical protein